MSSKQEFTSLSHSKSWETFSGSKGPLVRFGGVSSFVFLPLKKDADP